MGTWSIWHWIIVLVIVALIFGTKKLRNFGEDLGSAVKSFKKGMQDSSEDHSSAQLKADPLQPPAAEAPAENKSQNTP